MHTADPRGRSAILKLTFLIDSDGTIVPVMSPVLKIVGRRNKSVVMLLFISSATQVTMSVSICRMAKAPPLGTAFTSKRRAHQLIG